MKIFEMFQFYGSGARTRLYVFMLSASMFLLAGIPGISQNLDPTVEVSRTYVAGKMDVSKSQMKMAIPDSVLKFDIDFDYSVMDSPYKGSYEFRPYLLDIKPEVRMREGNSFFLRAGAGYGLHPVFDFVYSPKMKKAPFTMSLYGTHRSFFGQFRTLSSKQYPDFSRFEWDRKGRYPGYDSYTSAGVDGRADWKNGFFSFDLGYDGNADKDSLRTRGYNAFRAALRFSSNLMKEKYFFYDTRVFYRYAQDRVDADGKSGLNMHDFSVNASLGPVFSPAGRALIEISADVSNYGGAFSSLVGRVALTPKYVYTKNRWNLDLGVKISALFRDDPVTSMHRKNGQYIYPDVEIAFSAIKGYWDIYFKADGGEDINRYSDIIRRNRHFSFFYMRNGGQPLLDNTVEHIKAVLGFRGNIASRLSYDLRGGYANYGSMLFSSVCELGQGNFIPSAAYADCNCFFAVLDLKWHSQDVYAGLSAKYCGTDLNRREASVLEPSPMTVDADVVYNWKRRIFAGLHCNAATSRTGVAAILTESASGPAVPKIRVPGYVDLGISAEYRFNRKVSFWLYGGNLLNMTIQRVPLYAEDGISVTGGVTLSF